MAMDKIRTFIVEDSSVVRENLIAALEESAPIEVIGVAEDEPSAVAWLLDKDHGCELVDFITSPIEQAGVNILTGKQEMATRMDDIVAVVRKERDLTRVSRCG